MSDKLLMDGKAYRCFCTKDEIDIMKAQQEAEGETHDTMGLGVMPILMMYNACSTKENPIRSDSVYLLAQGLSSMMLSGELSPGMQSLQSMILFYCVPLEYPSIIFALLLTMRR